MQKTKSIFLNVIFFLQILLVFLLLIENRIELPVWLQVAGRFHPAVLHLPIGLLIFFVIILFLQNEFKKKAYKKIMLILLLLISITATITALFGFFLSQKGDYGTGALTQHKISGVLLSIFCYILLLIFDRYDNAKTLFIGISLITICSVLIVGHTGGTLTHGENYVFAPLKDNSQEAIPKDASAYRAVVYPILEKKCFSCHNDAKAKGKLVMTSINDFKKGGKEGQEWVSGKPEESRIIKYIHLPLEDDKHMPPDGKPQLTQLEMNSLRIWIKSGADFDLKLSELKDGDSLKIIASSFIPNDHQLENKVYSFKDVSEDIISKLNTPFRSVFRLYLNGPALQADFFIKESFQSKSLNELLEIKDQLVVLNLSKMPVVDTDLSVIANFKNLEKINLNFSKINGEGLNEMRTLKELTSVSLAGTDVTAESILPILNLPKLKELFVWNTKITEEDKIRLSGQYPNVSIATSQFKDERTLKLSKPVLVNEGIINPKDNVILKHAMPGVIIRYTLDGTTPDSTSAILYEKPFHLETTFKIKTIACKPGWYCSDILERTCFVKGLSPERAILLTPADKQYPGEGSKSLIDGRKGFIDVLKEPSWLGFRDNSFEAEFEFVKGYKPIQQIVISYAENIGGYIFPPTEVEVWAGENKLQLRMIKKIKIDEPKNDSPQKSEALTIQLNSDQAFTMYKLVAKPISKLPAWHSGKGKKGWFFIDEVFFY